MSTPLPLTPTAALPSHAQAAGAHRRRATAAAALVLALAVACASPAADDATGSAATPADYDAAMAALTPEIEAIDGVADVPFAGTASGTLTPRAGAVSVRIDLEDVGQEAGAEAVDAAGALVWHDLSLPVEVLTVTGFLPDRSQVSLTGRASSTVTAEEAEQRWGPR